MKRLCLPFSLSILGAAWELNQGETFGEASRDYTSKDTVYYLSYVEILIVVCAIASGH